LVKKQRTYEEGGLTEPEKPNRPKKPDKLERPEKLDKLNKQIAHSLGTTE
jgi:hypothetical protein